MSTVNYGQVDVVLNGETLTLKPTLAAYQKIDGRMGGLRQAIEQCSNMTLDGLCFIISAGAGLGKKESAELPEKVFREGTLNVLPNVTEYLVMLLNPTGKEISGDIEPGE